MLSVAAMSGGHCDYYLALAREDYYRQGGEPPGTWLGQGAALLGLSGDVTSDALRKHFGGYDLQNQPLVQNAGSPKRQPGWDLTFSAPKSVSILWSQAPLSLRQLVLQAHRRAVDEALRFLEEEATWSRLGKGGALRQRAGLVVAAFEHGTSRALDPQIHTHCLVLNLGVASDGKTRSILSKPFYEFKMVAGAIYRAELAYELYRLGLTTKRKSSWFELTAVPSALIQFFSQRRRAIEEALQSAGLESASAAAFATLATRPVKDVVPAREELFEGWQASGKDLGWNTPALLARERLSPRLQEKRACQALEIAIETLSSSSSHFGYRELLAEFSREACIQGVSVAAIRTTLKKTIEEERVLISLGQVAGEERFTTPKIARCEKALLESAQKLADATFRPATEDDVQRAIEKKRLAGQTNSSAPIVQLAKRLQRAVSKKSFTLTEEQALALRHLTQSKGRLKILSGFAGSGKTALLQAAKEVFESGDYRVVGCSLAAVAARQLELGSGIKSDTISKLLQRLEPSASRVWKHHAKQILRAAKKRPTYALDRLTLDSRTVLVVDEAGMVGTQQFERLVSAARKANAVLLLVGDARQLSAVSAGGAFEALCQRFGQAELQQITRQKNTKDRQAVKDFAEGKAAAALLPYAETGNLVIGTNHAEAQTELVRDWAKSGGIKRPSEHVLFAGTNQEVTELNSRAQALRLAAKKLQSAQKIRVGQESFYVGDRLMCLKNSKLLGVSNGSTGTLIGIKGLGKQRKLLLRMDEDATRVTIPLGDYDKLTLGYAFTTHKLQGSTVTHSYIHLSSRMTSREMAYVQGSRHRETIRLYTDQFEAGVELTEAMKRYESESLARALKVSPLVKKMAASKKKTLAHAVMDDTTSEKLSHKHPTRTH